MPLLPRRRRSARPTTTNSSTFLRSLAPPRRKPRPEATPDIDSDDERDEPEHMAPEERRLIADLTAEFADHPSARHRVRLGAVVVPNRGLCLLPLAFWRFEWCGFGGMGPEGVRLLDLRGNGLRLLSRKVGKLTGLRALLLGGNELESVPEEIGKLTHLRWLEISANRLRKLPEGVFAGLTSLQDLNLEENMLTDKSFPASIAACGKSLKKINLRSNDFVEVPQVFTKLLALTELDLQDNEIEFVPKGMFALKKLQSLTVRDGVDVATLPQSGVDKRRMSLDVSSSGETLGVRKNSFLNLPGVMVRGYSFHSEIDPSSRENSDEGTPPPKVDKRVHVHRRAPSAAA